MRCKGSSLFEIRIEWVWASLYKHKIRLQPTYVRPCVCDTLKHAYLWDTRQNKNLIWSIILIGERLVKVGQNYTFLTVNGKLVDSTPNRPIVGRQSANILARFWMLFFLRWLKKYNHSGFFSSTDNFKVWSSVLHQPIVGRLYTVGRLLMQNKPFKLSQLWTDNRTMTIIPTDYL